MYRRSKPTPRKYIYIASNNHRHRTNLTWITLATQPAWYTSLSPSTATCFRFVRGKNRRDIINCDHAPRACVRGRETISQGARRGGTVRYPLFSFRDNLDVGVFVPRLLRLLPWGRGEWKKPQTKNIHLGHATLRLFDYDRDDKHILASRKTQQQKMYKE